MKTSSKVVVFLLTLCPACIWGQTASATDNREIMKEIMGAFYPDYYLAKYPDVARATGGSQQGAFNHWTATGIAELRCPNPFFDPNYYKANNPDLARMNGEQLLQHWVTFGMFEGRAGNADFNLKFYVNHYPDLKVAFGADYNAAFLHWISNGNDEWRVTSTDRLLHMSVQKDGPSNKMFAAVVTKGEDPDLFRPDRTTGGKIGIGVGLLVGVYFGNPVAGASVGGLVGHGLDRICTRVANDITGPVWDQAERGVIGKNLGEAGREVTDALKEARRHLFGH